MPVLKNGKHERYAQGLAKGKTADDAYVEAGFKRNRGNAATLKAKQSIQDRVTEIKGKVSEKVTEKLAIDKAWVMAKLVENANRAMQVEAVKVDGENIGEYQYQGNVANRALELIGKEFGMFVERKEVGGPGDFATMLDAELAEHLLEQAEALGLSSGMDLAEAAEVLSGMAPGNETVN